MVLDSVCNNHQAWCLAMACNFLCRFLVIILSHTSTCIMEAKASWRPEFNRGERNPPLTVGDSGRFWLERTTERQ